MKKVEKWDAILLTVNWRIENNWNQGFWIFWWSCANGKQLRTNRIHGMKTRGKSVTGHKYHCLIKNRSDYW